MRLETGSEIVRDDQSVVTTGTFDGVHLGHQAILAYLVERARTLGGVPTVVTFDPHPREVLTGRRVPLLTTMAERAALLAAYGVERVVVVPFSRELSLLDPDPYVEEVLLGRVGMREIVIGYDHRFGRGRSGGRETLERIGAERGFTVDVIPEHIEHGVTVSSSEIRRQLADEGDAREATLLLGRPYRFAGLVVRGDQRGRTIGYPTANLRVGDDRKLLPKPGVYAVRAHAAEEVRNGMMNVGRRPTFETDGALSVEVHLFEFDGDLYGRTVTVDLVERLRDERPFSGVDALRQQLAADEAGARAALSTRVQSP